MIEHVRFSSTILILTLVMLGAGFTACKKDVPPSLFDPNYSSGAPPTVTAIAPAPNSPPPNTPLAGVTTITLTGNNFSSVLGANLVFFDALRATVLEASSSQLRVKAPLLVKDSIRVKVAVQGSEAFSNTMLYKLEPAARDFGDLSSLAEPFGIAVDNLGNVYVSVLFNGVVDSVYKITPDGIRTGFSRGLSSSVPRWSTMKVGPGGFIYSSALGRTALFRIPLTGGSPSIWQNAGGLGIVYDFDFDPQGILWAGGNNPAIYSVTQARVIRAFPFRADVRSVRVFNGYLYAGGLSFPDSVERIVRFRIVSSDSLGAREDYFNFSAAYPGARVYAITFSADGDMFIGTDESAGSIVVVRPNLTSEKFYPGVLKAQSLVFAYGTGVNLFVTRTGPATGNADKRVIMVNTQKPSAPYYGRGDS